MPARKVPAKDEVARYVTSYVTRELVQPAADGTADPELATIAVTLAERLARTPSGVIVDIGCGHGTLLQRLAELPLFMEQTGWLYVAVDDDEKLDQLARLTRKLAVSRRVEPVDLKTFYDSWPHRGSPQLVFCRNVLHELSIDQTAVLLNRIAANTDSNDELIIQDLLRLPESERHHSCWLSDKLADCLRACGFQQITPILQGSKSGNAWFNLLAKNRAGVAPPIEEVQARIITARQEQWDLWIALDRAREEALPHRSELVAALDLDLQLESLTRELRNLGALQLDLPPDLARRVRTVEFFRRVEAFVRSGALVKQLPAESAHFRERGEALNIMEAYLRSQSRLAMVYGGSGTGKTTFISHLLKGRLYEKSFVSINAHASRGLWPLIEQLFAQVGLNIPGDMLSVLGNIEYASVESAIRQFVNRYAPEMVIVIENFDSWLDSNGAIIDDGVARLLELLASKDKTKLIFTSRFQYVPPRLVAATGGEVPTTVRMGRFLTDLTVVNILDDHFDRGKAGIGDYPLRLIQAIDRHPLIAFLAGRVLANSGAGVLLDAQFISEVQRQLRSELMARLVDEQMLPAVEVASKLRIPVPLTMLERLSSPDSVFRARSSEVLYTVPDHRWNELVTTLGLLRRRTVDDLAPAMPAEHEFTDSAEHARIAESYWSVHQSDDDPKWIRECHFHRMLSGSVAPGQLASYAGKYYLPELIASAHYCFRTKRDFPLALELYEAAAGLAPLDEQSLMWRASCLIRTGKRDQGDAEYRRLAMSYPSNIGLRTSHVDALLYARDDQAAIDALTTYDLGPDKSSWVAQQWGRAHLGLHQYEKAIPIFRSLIAAGNAESHCYVYLARALQQYGDVEQAIEVLRHGKKVYPENVAIQTSLGADLERHRNDAEALEVLLPMFRDAPGNTRAALAIIRVHLRQGDIDSAERVSRLAQRHVVGAMRPFMITAEAEILIARNQAMAAVEFLRQQVSDDENLTGLLLEAFIQVINKEMNSDRRARMIQEAMAVPIPDRWQMNVPVQVTLARLAIAAGDQKRFDRALDRLAETLVNPVELSRLRQQWDAAQTGS